MGPIKVLHNKWLPAFKGCDHKIFECRPYSPDKPKNSYQVISDQIIDTISKWLTSNPPSIEILNDDQKKDKVKESKAIKQQMSKNVVAQDEEKKESEIQSEFDEVLD